MTTAANKTRRTVPIIDLGKEYLSLQKEIDAALHRVLISGSYILGSETDHFEKELAAYCGVSHAVGVNSGTDALMMAYRALNLRPGDEIIMPAMSFIATVEPAILLGVKPVFVDIDPISLTLKASEVRAKITAKTKAVVAVHLYGQCADMDELMRICDEKKLSLVEDMAQAIGSAYKGRKAGAFGRLACLSFFPTKNLGAFGDAGAVLTSSPELAERLKSLRNHGAKIKYHHDEVGYNSRLDEVQSAILRVKLPHLDSWNKKRREFAAHYDRLLSDLPIERPQQADDRMHIYHLYSIQTPKRDALKVFLEKEGISTGLHYPKPLHLQEALKSFGGKTGDFPVSEKLAQQTLSLPLYPFMTADDVAYVSEAIKRFFQNG